MRGRVLLRLKEEDCVAGRLERVCLCVRASVRVCVWGGMQERGPGGVGGVGRRDGGGMSLAVLCQVRGLNGRAGGGRGRFGRTRTNEARGKYGSMSDCFH